jgi:hypothetical protein
MGIYYVQKHEEDSKLLGHIWKVAGHSTRHDIRHPFYSMHTRVEVTNNVAQVRFQVLTAASMMFRAVFWVILPCKMIPDDGGSTQL